LPKNPPVCALLRGMEGARTYLKFGPLMPLFIVRTQQSPE
jgi:hypothetical protein